MTDNEIIKALCDCEGVDGISYCNSCPLYEKDGCIHILSKEAKDLINRHKAEIEKLKEELDGETVKNMSLGHEIERLQEIVHLYSLQYGTVTAQSERIAQIKNEAIKEFAEIIKGVVECGICLTENETDYLCLRINEEAKEMENKDEP